MDLRKATQNSQEISAALKRMEASFPRIKQLIAENKAMLGKIMDKTDMAEVRSLQKQYADFDEMLEDLSHTVYVTAEMSDGVERTEAKIVKTYRG